jgi:DNA mismatch endonuclease (patch repair protein)
MFTRARVAVFVDGCFWHACPDHLVWPKSNQAFWREKLLGNARRDHETDQKMADAGWHVIRVWEHDSTESASDRVESVVIARIAESRSALAA